MNTRLTRFYQSNSGLRAPLISILSVPKVILFAIKRKYFDIFPVLPWIPFNAIKKLDSVITKNFLVLEVGSGMSTVWFSKRVSQLYSREADLNWYQRLKGRLQECSNVQLAYTWESDKICNFDEFPDNYFDLLFIDGGPRERCLINGYTKVKRGGYIYIDNIDDPALVNNSKEVLASMASQGDSLEFFADFVPGNLMVNEGALLKKN